MFLLGGLFLVDSLYHNQFLLINKINIVFIKTRLSIVNDFVIRCRQFKLRVKIFFAFFSTSFGRFLAADHEYLLFSLSKSFFPLEKYEILERCRFSRKMHPFTKCAKFSILLFFFPSENNFFRSSIKN